MLIGLKSGFFAFIVDRLFLFFFGKLSASKTAFL